MSGAMRGSEHIDVERYYDTATDRPAADAHLATCPECRASLTALERQLRDLTCAELVELVTEYLEGAVDETLRMRIDEHLRLCEGCRTYIDQVRTTVATVGRVPADTHLPSEVRTALLELFRSGPGGPTDQGPSPTE